MELTNIETFLEELTGTLYKKFKQESSKQNNEFIKNFCKRDESNQINVYNLYALKILKIIDLECISNVFFDQEKKILPVKSERKESNEYISNSEIYNVVNEVKIKPENQTILKNICSRIRVLSCLDIWENDIDCETFCYDQEVTDKYLEKCKIYFLKNKNYMRYARLLKVALDNGKYFELPDFLPNNINEYRTFLRQPFIYIILQPYNYLIKDIIEEDVTIIRATLIDGEFIFY